jgi:3-isopropylmalate/(R)-2-methylmalate dehydratase small subunit
MELILRSHVLTKYGDNISTDNIIQAKYMTSTKLEDLAKICMRDIDPEFPQRMAPGGFLVAGKNFGCGSSRERAPIALKAAGVKAIVAEEFARIFYRNSLNICLPVIECPDAAEAINQGDELEINIVSGSIRNMKKGTILQGIPIPEFLLEMMRGGGLVAFLKQQLVQGK